MTPTILNILRLHARHAAARAYAPYSKFRVGAAVLTDDGRIFSGCNVENASYGLTICAERNSIFQAVAAGAKSLRAVVIFTFTNEAAAPCGACRQVIREFAGPDVPIRSFGTGSHVLEGTLDSLLPNSFGPGDLGLAVPTSGSASQTEFKPRLVVDIDNVVTATDVVMRAIISEFTGGKVKLKYEDIRRFKYQDCRDQQGDNIDKETWDKVHEAFSADPRVLELAPIAGAVESLKDLSKRWEVRLATSRLPAAREATIAWLNRQGLGHLAIHFTNPHKKHDSLSIATASIEDDRNQAEDFSWAGVPLSLVLAHPWNSERNRDSSPEPQIERVVDWAAIVRRLNEVVPS